MTQPVDLDAYFERIGLHRHQINKCIERHRNSQPPVAARHVQAIVAHLNVEIVHFVTYCFLFCLEYCRADEKRGFDLHVLREWQ